MKKTLILGFASLMVMFAINGCSLLFPSEDDFLTIPKTPYTGNEIRTDGFYYKIWNNQGTHFGQITFLYKNGVVLQRGGTADDLSTLTEKAGQDFSFDITDNKGFWGVFQVKNDNIIYERWVGTQLGYLVYREEGVIVNDTTFVMNERSRMNQGEKTEIKTIEDYYYFKELSPKPDSTNAVIMDHEPQPSQAE